MKRRTLLTAVGSALGTVLLIAGLTIQLLAPALGAAGVAGAIVTGAIAFLGVLVGVAAGATLGLTIARSFDDWQQSVQRVLSGYAAFGIVFTLLILLTLVAPSETQRYLTFEIRAGVSLFAFAVVHGSYYTREVPVDVN